jgi:hypothetical protein
MGQRNFSSISLGVKEQGGWRARKLGFEVVRTTAMNMSRKKEKRRGMHHSIRGTAYCP